MKAEISESPFTLGNFIVPVGKRHYNMVVAHCYRITMSVMNCCAYPVSFNYFFIGFIMLVLYPCEQRRAKIEIDQLIIIDFFNSCAGTVYYFCFRIWPIALRPD